ncbi:DUF3450 family protein [Litorilituus lipolyticus]|uniref:DUF3450 family protein n=1 Tax=Litorilituus lipolyticus TaxID=2491017 RepID=A0A502L6N1_9GAMM|nr:DUF3450 family protein [Litorilituus lipolyticus]TPH18609.1 DUF3450 family protein [Litorilituus lipolyticus]
MKALSKGVFCAAALCASFGSQAQENLTELMQQWLDIESQKGQLQLDWNTKKQQLEQTQSLLIVEKTELASLLKKADTDRSDVDERRIELSEKQSLLEQEQVAVRKQILQATAFCQKLLMRLPPPLQEQWQEKLLLLTQEGATDSEKLERILSLYQLVNEFDERIALNRGSMAIPSESGNTKNLLVTQMYLGVSQGWYVSDDGLHYGYGRADSSGWLWWHNESSSAELGRVLAAQDLLKLRDILQKPTTAKFIDLPVKVTSQKAES